MLSDMDVLEILSSYCTLLTLVEVNEQPSFDNEFFKDAYKEIDDYYKAGAPANEQLANLLLLYSNLLQTVKDGKIPAPEFLEECKEEMSIIYKKLFPDQDFEETYKEIKDFAISERPLKH